MMIKTAEVLKQIRQAAYEDELQKIALPLPLVGAKVGTFLGKQMHTIGESFGNLAKGKWGKSKAAMAILGAGALGAGSAAVGTGRAAFGDHD
jgi:hypothetical protein